MRFNKINVQRLIVSGAFLGSAFYLASTAVVELKKVFK